MKNHNFIDKAPRNYDDCLVNEKRCGNATDTAWCIPKDSKCPITKMKIDTGDPLGNYTEFIDLREGFKLYFSRENTGFYPVVEFRIDEGEGICLDNT